MKRANGILLAGICAISCLLGAAHWFHTKPVHAQQQTGYYDDGTFYISASIDVDSNYNLTTDSYMEVEFDDYEDIDEIEVDGYADQDGGLLISGYSVGNDYDPADVEFYSKAPVAPGHEYGIESDGYACFDDGEGDEDCEPVGYTYASVNVYSPPPRIYGMNPSSVYQGDQGTLTLTGADFIENSTDQLTLNFSGPTNPFTLTSAPSTCTTSCTATYSYDFTGYPPGTYQLSLTNHEASSDNYSFTVNQYTPQTLPPDPCAITSNPQTGYSSIVPTGAPGGSGTMSVSFSGATFSNLSPTTVSYGPYSTPSSIASSLASLITKNYAQKGLFARAFGSSIVYGGVAALGSVSNIATGSSFTTEVSSTAANAAAAACYAIPHIPCLGLFPNYDTPRLYASEGITETPRQHIIRRHISNTPSLGPPPTTVYANTVGATPDQVFSIVQTYNFHTVLQGKPGKGGGLDYTFPTRTVGGVTFGLIGIDGSGNNLQTNHFVLSPDKCSVITSFPIAP